MRQDLGRSLRASAACSVSELAASIFICLHWRSNVPLEETLDGFAALVDAGKIRYWGVSNFDVVDMIELRDLISGADVAAARSCTISRGAASSTNCYLGAANEEFRSLPIRPSSKGCSLIVS